MKQKKTHTNWFVMVFNLLVLGDVISLYSHFSSIGNRSGWIAVSHILMCCVGVMSIVALYGIWKWKKWGLYLFAAGTIVGWIISFATNTTGILLTLSEIAFSVLFNFLLFRFLIFPVLGLFDGKQTINTAKNAAVRTKDQPSYRERRMGWMFIVITCAFFGLIGFGTVMMKGVLVKPEVKTTIETFIQDVASENTDAAYSMMSSDFKKNTTKDSFSQDLSNVKMSYTGFLSQRQTGFTITHGNDGSLEYKYRADVTFVGGGHRSIQATLIKEGTTWKIVSIDITTGMQSIH